MMAEIAGGGEEGRPAVFVAAIAGDALRGGQRRVDHRAVGGVEGEGEEPEIVGAVLALAEPGADDDRADRRLLEHPAGGDVRRSTRRASRATSASARSSPCRTSQPPIASTKRLYFILLQSAISSGAGSGRPSQRLGEEAAGERAVGEQLDALRRGRRRVMSSAARRSSSEKQTWLVAIGMPSFDEQRAGDRCRNW